MMPRKFTDSELDEADALRAQGEKWDVVEAILGAGIKGACDYRRRTYRPGYSSHAPAAWLVKVAGMTLPPVLTQAEADQLVLCSQGATKHALFLRDGV